MLSKKTLISLTAFFFFANFTFAQQWEGGTTSNSQIYRDGPVGIGRTAATGIALRTKGVLDLQAKYDDYADRTFFYWGGENDQSTYMSIAAGGQFVVRSGRNSSLKNHLKVEGGTGNVGIGTDAPDEKLCVNGTIKAKEVVVTSLGWADYVFKSDYELKDLSEVEAFIKENNHLPGIPSEKEVEEKGVSVGEMQIKLLEKVEELTLHLIDLKKENINLHEKLTALEKKN